MGILPEKLNLLTHLSIIKKFQVNQLQHYQKIKKTPKNHLTRHFFNQHSYFSEVGSIQAIHKKIKILEIIAEGKGINSMFLTPESNVFLEKSEFYNDLTQKGVRNSDYDTKH